MAALPILLGLSPLGGGDLHQESHELVRRLQGRGGYSTDPDGPRDRELLAWAEMHALARQRLDSVGDNILPDKATELLGTWEAYLRVTNTAARSVAERQVRAQRFYDLIVAANETDLAAFVAAIAPGAVIHTPDVAAVNAANASAETIFHFMLQLSDAQYEDPKFRRAFDILVRILPMRALGSMSRAADLDQQVFTTTNAVWGDATQRLDRTAIEDGIVGVQPADRNLARYRDYGPLSLIRADDLNGLQEEFVHEGIAGISAAPSAEDSLYRFFAGTMAVGTANQIDSGEWRDRLCTLVCRFTTTDVRPGQAGETGINAAAEFVIPFYTGDGETGTAGGGARYEALITSSNFIRASSVDGDLEIFNDDAVPWFVVGCVYAGGDTGER